MPEPLPQLLSQMGSEGSQQARKCRGGALCKGAVLLDVAHEDHQGRDGRIQIERFDVARNLVDRAGEEPLLGGCALPRRELACTVLRIDPLDDQAIGTLEEAKDPGNPVGGPGSGLAQRTDEHLVEPHGVGPVLRHHVVRVDDVAAALGHLLRDLLEHNLLIRGQGLAVLPAHLIRRDPALPKPLAGFAVYRCLAVVTHLLGGIETPVRSGAVTCVGNEVAIAPGLDHAGIEKLLEGLLGGDQTEVVEHLVPEACVEQMQHGVLSSTHIQVDRHPVALRLRGPGGLGVPRIAEPQVVPAAPGPLGHGVGIAPRALPRVGIARLDPALDPCQWWLEVGAGLVILELRQLDGQIRLGHQLGRAVLEMQHRKRLTPVALATEEPVAQPVADRTAAGTLRLEPLDHAALGIRRAQPVEVSGVHVDAFPAEGLA